MPPYQYAPISSPFVGTIAETMQRPAQALAAAEIAKGNAWAQAAQGIGQAASGAIQQATDPRRQLEQQQVESNKRAQQFTGTVNQIIATLTTQNPDGTRTLDRGRLQQAFAAQNVPLAMQEQTFKALDDVDKSIQSFNTARTDHLADLAHGVLKAGATPDALQFGMALAKANGVVTDAQLDPIVQAVANGGDIKALLTQVRGTSEKYKEVDKPVVLPRPGAQLVSPAGDTLATAPQTPEKPVNVPAGGTLVDPNSGKAIFSAPEKPEKPGSLEEQYLTAKTNGDTAAAARILGTIKDTAAAKKDPATAALAGELASLRADEAKARLQKLQEQNAPVDITNNINTTASGKKYVDLSDFQTPESKEKARIAAEAAGIRPINKDAADGLRAADTARTNLTALLAQIEPFLAKDATGRLLKGPDNTLAKVFQSNPTLGAYGSWRTAAIQAVQALAEKGMGLRLNRSEIDLMLENDIPQITDDGPTAKQRVQNLFTLLDNKEKGLLVRDRSGASDAPKNPFRK